MGSAFHQSAARKTRFDRFQVEQGWEPLTAISPCRTCWHGYKDAGVRALELYPHVQPWVALAAQDNLSWKIESASLDEEELGPLGAWL